MDQHFPIQFSGFAVRLLCKKCTIFLALLPNDHPVYRVIIETMCRFVYYDNLWTAHFNSVLCKRPNGRW